VTQRLTQSFIEAQSGDGRDRIVFDSQVPGFGLRITPIGTKLFIVQARAAGRKRRLTIGMPPGMSLSKARGEALQALAAMRSGIDPTVERRARSAKSITIRALSERWLTEFVVPKLKPRTQYDYKQLLVSYILPALGHLTVAEIAREHVEKLHLSMSNKPRRANYTVATTRALLSFAVRHGLKANNPARDIKAYRQNNRERYLTEAEFAAAAAGIGAAEKAGVITPFAAAGVRLALFTGARCGEVTAFKWEHVDWARRLIRLPDSKNNEPRTVHLSEAAIEVLRRLPRIGEFVIAGRRASYTNLSRAWATARKLAGLKDVRLHDLRHSYASLAVARGVPLYTVGKLLGHRDPATTQRYAHLAPEVVQAANDELGAAMQAAIKGGKPRGRP
jgi:integrase